MRQPSKKYDPKFIKAVLRNNETISNEKIMKKLNKLTRSYFGKAGEIKCGESGRAIFFFISDFDRGNIESFEKKMERISNKTGFFYEVFIKN